jgi:hypothetical protein
MQNKQKRQSLRNADCLPTRGPTHDARTWEHMQRGVARGPTDPLAIGPCAQDSQAPVTTVARSCRARSVTVAACASRGRRAHTEKCVAARSSGRELGDRCRCGSTAAPEPPGPTPLPPPPDRVRSESRPKHDRRADDSRSSAVTPTAKEHSPAACSSEEPIWRTPCATRGRTACAAERTAHRTQTHACHGPDAHTGTRNVPCARRAKQEGRVRQFPACAFWRAHARTEERTKQQRRAPAHAREQHRQEPGARVRARRSAGRPPHTEDSRLLHSAPLAPP